MQVSNPATRSTTKENMIITIKENDRDRAKRLLRCDDVYSILWEIRQDLRNKTKYGTKLDKEEVMREYMEIIDESGLLELYQ